MKVLQRAEGEHLPEPSWPADIEGSQETTGEIQTWKGFPANKQQAGVGHVEMESESPSAEPIPETDWRERALRLQAEMENYRKRQRRLAQEQIDSESQRLLRAFLPVVDNLERALSAPAGDTEALREGVKLTHRAALQLLGREGVKPIRPDNRAFDPNWHEAVATVGHSGAGAVPNTVVQTTEPGYRLEDKLLRPAKVVVAV